MFFFLFYYEKYEKKKKLNIIKINNFFIYI